MMTFFVPEIISPSPQRIMPEVPSNMQQELAHLELEARGPLVHRMSVASTSSAYGETPITPLQPHQMNARGQQGPGFTASYQHTNASAYQNIDRGNLQSGGMRPEPDSPKFSPFPKPRDAGPNVPLSDEDKEEVLERARALVLKSSDPEMQLAWAQDALSWVETASQYAARIQPEGAPPRSITPKVEHALRVDALNIVSFLAEQHHPKAEFMKSMWLEFGKFGYRVDKKESFLGYKRAAEKGYARAEYRMGMQFENSNNYAKAIEHYDKGVEMGDSAAHYRMGMMTLLGQCGIQQDYQHGVDLIRYSADTADENAPQGAYVYGMLLARELPNVNVPDHCLSYDLNDAKLFIEKAAYLGFAKAQLKMAQAYELCQLGCEFEPALSLHYNALASRQGEPEADMAISKWFLCGFEGVFEKDEELAFVFAKRAAQANMPTAEFALGYFYEIGMYVPVDLHESAAWYQKAADHGNKDALGRIDSIKKNNTLSKSDHEQVALSRIKSQYGSQRGNRPDRFKQRANPMPAITDDVVDMPDPRISYTGPGKPQGIPPQRPVSVAPYPEDDVARPGYPPGPPGPFNGQGLRPRSQIAPAADRPGSAFGVRPPVHSNTLNNAFNQNQGRPSEQLRPSTSMGNMHVPEGRGSNPAGRDRVVSSGWEPQLPPKQPLSQSNQGFLPPVDMGRPLNFEQATNRLQKPPPLNMNKPQPPPSQPPQNYAPDPRQRMSPGHGGRPDPAAQRRDQAPNSAQRPPRASSMAMSPPPITSPQNSQHRHSQPMQNPAQGQSRASQRPPAHTMSSQGPHSRPPSAAPSAAPSTAPSTTSSGPPKKQGPATFEEMGIPTVKNDNDCPERHASPSTSPPASPASPPSQLSPPSPNHISSLRSTFVHNLHPPSPSANNSSPPPDKMAPRAAKPKASTPATTSDTASTASLSPLKPKTEKVKVEKSSTAKAKTSKAEKAARVEKAIKDGNANVVKAVKKEAAAGCSGSGGKSAKGKDEGKGKSGEGKDAKVTGEEAEALIREYLKEQNRPYSATEVVANLRGRVTKTIADKLLKEMEQAGQIMGKATNGDKKGSQWVFWCLQDPADTATPEELATMDATITTLRETTLPPLKAHLKALTTKLTTILSAPTTSDLAVLVNNLQASNAEKREKLRVFKEGGVRMVSKEEKERVEREWKFWRRKREKCFKELEGMLMEGMGSREDVWEKVGIEDGDADL
ncbi:hypothetical protein G7Y89_g8758 [Cudoniella acicularis]|uniref:Homologous-pairing protein 2 winged helix domain-containing protein n=1 Tax=Cudoniella acicularis TaxID=354080 RepID=A0A8H4RG11_9HELO|nr:hypothetical protein G7Y89_g8758 [Cudoniella acicularis]